MLQQLRTLIGSLAGGKTTPDGELKEGRSEAETAGWALYHFGACPYCVRVRHVMRSLGLNIELRDIRSERAHRDELVAGGGRATVPCLRVRKESGSEIWMYESSEIVRFLRQSFSE